MNNIAIILARGGSKRLPGKNILPLNGVPMIAWSIEAAVQSEKFSRVVVSTDCEKIAEIALKYGAQVPFLRQESADDVATSSVATLAALRQSQDYWNEDYQVVAQLMANCPMRSANDIVRAFDNFVQKKAPSQISCFKFGWMNPWWAARVGSDGRPKWLFPKAFSFRSQDLPPLVCPSGAIWLAQKAAFEVAGTFYMKDHIFHEISWFSALDIDDDQDLIMAKACMYLREIRELSL